MKHLLAFLLSVMSSAALAQTTATVDPGPAPAQVLLNEAARPDNCAPTGLTASGEYVFPLECRAFVERERAAKAAQQKPATVEEKSAAVQEKAEEKPAAVAETPAAKQPEARQEAKRSNQMAPAAGKPAKKLLEAVSLPKRPEQQGPRQRAASANDCTHYRSYNPATGSYRGLDGKTWGCRHAQAKR
jgi:BA14K-like protein